MNPIKQILGLLDRSFFPNGCFICGEMSEGVLCGECSKRLAKEMCACCPECGNRPLMCGCMPESLKESGCVGFSHLMMYNMKDFEVSSRFILRLKESDRRDAVSMAVDMLSDLTGDRHGYIITNVPRRKSAIVEYGFDQAELIARALAKRTGGEYIRLIKHIGNSEQKVLNTKERFEASMSSFRLISEKGRGRRILLIDDVVTTGASMSKCVKLLYGSGAESVECAACAKSVSSCGNNKSARY